MSGIATRSRTARLAAAAAQSQPSVDGASGDGEPPEDPNLPGQSEPPLAGAASDELTPDKCAICISPPVNRCKTNSCTHEFCFGCLLEWSKVKPECPLCKVAFTKLYYNYRTPENGEEEFDEYNVPQLQNFFGLQPELNLRWLSRFGPDAPSSSRSPSAHYDNYMNDLFGLGGFREFRASSTPPVTNQQQQGQQQATSSVADDFRGSLESYWQTMIRMSSPPRQSRFGSRFSRVPPPPPTLPPVAHSSRTSGGDPDTRRPESASILRIMDFGGLGIEPLTLYFGPTSSSAGTTERPENPFLLPNDGLAGSELQPVPDANQSYQRRRRIYDRGLWVNPFHSSLHAGTVFFPSVEYFRTHPTSYSRLKPWLKRELIVLVGLTTQRSTLAALYDLILSLLLRFDIRSREFREMIRIYFPTTMRVKHFQHEFYHFVLSGMRMEWYDSQASYPTEQHQPQRQRSSGSGEQPGTSSAAAAAATASAIPVITLDSDTEEIEAPAGRFPAPPQLIMYSNDRPSRQRSRSSRSRRARDRRSPRSSFATSPAPPPRQHNHFTLRTDHHRHRHCGRPLLGLPEIDNMLLNAQRAGLANFLAERRRHRREELREAARPAQTVPPPPPTEPAADANGGGGGGGEDSDDCLLLGVHPIIKPPPLAVITIDSEEEDGVKTEREDGTHEQAEDTTSTSTLPPRPSLPPTAPLESLEIDVLSVGSSSPAASTSSVDVLDLPDLELAQPRSPQPSTSRGLVAHRMRSNHYLMNRLLNDMRKNRLSRKSEQQGAEGRERGGNSSSPKSKRRRYRSPSSSSSSSKHSSSSSDAGLSKFTLAMIRNGIDENPGPWSISPQWEHDILGGVGEPATTTTQTTTDTALSSNQPRPSQLLIPHEQTEGRWESADDDADDEDAEVQSGFRALTADYMDECSSSSEPQRDLNPQSPYSPFSHSVTADTAATVASVEAAYNATVDNMIRAIMQEQDEEEEEEEEEGHEEEEDIEEASNVASNGSESATEVEASTDQEDQDQEGRDFSDPNLSYAPYPRELFRISPSPEAREVEEDDEREYPTPPPLLSYYGSTVPAEEEVQD